MSHLDHLSDEQANRLYDAAAADYERGADEAIADADAAEMVVQGLVKVTQNGSRLTLLKGAPSKPEENFTIELT